MPAKEQRTTIGTAARYYQPAIASVIAQAPKITKTNRQDVYDIDLVERGRMTRRPRTVPPPSVPLASGSLEKTAPPTAKGYATDVTKSRPTPWYRTTKGIAIITVVAFVVVGVVVGVAVGEMVTEHGRSGDSVQSKVEVSTTLAHTMTTSSIPSTIATSAGSGGAGGDENSSNNNPNTNTGKVPITSAGPGR